MQNTYLVKLCLLGEHERTLYQLVTADNESDAELKALINESISGEVEERTGYYSDGIEDYQTLSVTPIDSDKVEYIRQIFNA